MAKSKKEPLQLPTGKLALTKDPRVYARALSRIEPGYRRLVGLDLASSCGVSYCDIVPGQPVTDAPIIGGQWDLSIGTHDTQSIRYVRLKKFLEVIEPDLIFYEEVKFTGAVPPGMRNNIQAIVARAVTGAQVVQGLCAILVTWAEERNIPCQAIPIGTIKKFATGKGNANKVDMIKACNEHHGTDFETEDYESTGVDNIADSMWLCHMAVQNYSEGI